MCWTLGPSILTVLAKAATHQMEIWSLFSVLACHKPSRFALHKKKFAVKEFLWTRDTVSMWLNRTYFVNLKKMFFFHNVDMTSKVANCGVHWTGICIFLKLLIVVLIEQVYVYFFAAAILLLGGALGCYGEQVPQSFLQFVDFINCKFLYLRIIIYSSLFLFFHIPCYLDNTPQKVFSFFFFFGKCFCFEFNVDNFCLLIDGC